MFHEETLEHRSVQIKYLLRFLFFEYEKVYLCKILHYTLLAQYIAIPMKLNV